MREHFRRFDSKISFFAFADIITAVSGMLIFITLLLATDLGRPTNSQSQSANSELERQLNETLAKEVQVDADNQRLQGLLADANTAPDPEKLRADISRLRAELADEKSKHASMTEQLAASKSALESQDKVLGITDVREQIPKEAEELAALNRDESKVHDQITALEQKIASVQSKILKLRNREGQVWLIPDRKNTSKEPILATVNATGVRIERFDHPEQAQQFGKSGARADFESYLKKAKPQEQYVVFLIRPSGIALFKDLVQTARDGGFEVGFDALEEDREVHFTRPPPIDDEAVPKGRSGYGGGASAGGASSGQSGPASTTGAGPSAGEATGAGAAATNENGGHSPTVNQTGSPMTNTTGQTNGSAAAMSHTNAASPQPATIPPPKHKSWWQRFLEWIGIG